ncbi:MAG: phage holin family protein [Mycobacteriales bacterium]
MAGRDERTDDPSLGDLVATATRDLSSLMRQELELAKVEIKRDVVAAGKGAGGLGAAGFSGLLGVIFLSIAAAYALGRVVPLGAGFLIVGILYLLVAGLAGLIGVKSFKKMKPPTKTIETLKDDAAWAKHPTVAPTRRT